MGSEGPWVGSKELAGRKAGLRTSPLRTDFLAVCPLIYPWKSALEL